MEVVEGEEEVLKEADKGGGETACSKLSSLA